MHIIEPLQRLLKCYSNDRDKGRTIAYSKAIAFITSLGFPIKSAEDVESMPTVGAGIRKKIVEILQTGGLQKADNLQLLERNQVQDVYTQVWGIGS
jgi:DNA polymerase lambda